MWDFRNKNNFFKKVLMSAKKPVYCLVLLAKSFLTPLRIRLQNLSSFAKSAIKLWSFKELIKKPKMTSHTNFKRL